MILGGLSVMFMSTKQLVIALIVAILVLVIGLFTREARKTYEEDIKQDPIKHVLVVVIG